MARPLRIERAGAWYHVTARGVERRLIYMDDRDRRRWLAEAVPLFRLVVHGYVMMSNHYHLILETRAANLARAMQWLQTCYSMGFNRRFRRVANK
jgi:REP element-mobilizing transposase RayT